MADVIAIKLFVAGVMPTKYVCCNCYVADVIAKVTDGIAYKGGCRSTGTCYSHKWQLEWPLGQFYFNLSSGNVKQNLIPYVWVADGIFLCVC